VNSGSGAVRVAPGAGVPPAVPVGALVVVVVGVVAGGAVCVLVVVAGVRCVTAGAPATDTVLVSEPQALSAAPAQVQSRSAAISLCFITGMVFAVRAALPSLQDPPYDGYTRPVRGTLLDERWPVLRRSHEPLRSTQQTMSASPAQKPSGGTKRRLGRTRGSRSEMVRASALFILAALAIVFALLNLNDVEVHWAFGSGKAPLIIVIVISLLVGIVLTYFGERVSRRQRD
jgi:uncharacterized integral membrane protein